VLLTLDHDALVQSAYKLPPLPQTAARLAALVSRDDTELGEIVEVIELDPPLTLKLLRVANSVFGASRYPVGTVRDAVLRLGTGTVSGFAVASCVKSLLGKTIPGYNLPVSEFWNHALAAAFAAEIIIKFSKVSVSPLAFTAGLLHDIGKLVLGNFLSQEALTWISRAIQEGKQTAFQAETEILSLHHGEVGGVIAQHWGLPDCLVKGIIYHHNPDECGETICYATSLANLVAHRLTAEHQAASAEPENNVAHDTAHDLERLGLAQQNFTELCVAVHDRVKMVSGQWDSDNGSDLKHGRP